MIIPNLGMTRKTGIADALFTPVQQRVLGLLFAQPDRRFRGSELIQLVQGGTGAVHRQLSRLASSGLITVHRVGNQKHYQANRESPVASELEGLVVKTIGIVEPLRRALKPLAQRIQAAFVYGSIAKRVDRVTSDIDLLVISDALRYSDIFQALQKAQRVLAREINPTVMTRSEWIAKRTRKDSFAARIAERPKLFVIGSDADLS
jgi:predicted nucleotidyltransferase